MADVMTDPAATSSQTVGPFFSFGLCVNPALGRIASPDTPGDHIRLSVHVYDGAGAPVTDAMIELSQTDAEGKCEASETFRGFGRLGTDARGACTFETVRPGVSPDRQADEAAHVNVCLFMRGLLRQIYTRIYFAGDPALSRDATLRLVPEERRTTLLAQRVQEPATDWRFDIHLQGEHETVFFDV
jgi:protocatechuate 3,4-dioxygenase alpha subunit